MPPAHVVQALFDTPLRLRTDDTAFGNTLLEMGFDQALCRKRIEGNITRKEGVALYEFYVRGGGPATHTQKVGGRQTIFFNKDIKLSHPDDVIFRASHRAQSSPTTRFSCKTKKNVGSACPKWLCMDAGEAKDAV